jgi:hypothetical protein
LSDTDADVDAMELKPVDARMQYWPLAFNLTEHMDL